MTDSMNDVYASKIACYGDSTQWGANGGKHRIEGLTSPDLLQRLFTAAGASITVDNKGLSGLDTKGRLLGSAAINDNITQPRPPAEPWTSEMTGSDARWIVNNTLINDVLLFTTPAPVNQFTMWYEELIRIAVENGRNVIVETPNPVTYLDLNQVKIDHFAAFMQAQRNVVTSFDGLASDPTNTCSVHLVDQFQIITEYMPNWRAGLTGDGIHPNGMIYAAKALNLFWTLHPLVTASAESGLAKRGAWSAPTMPRHIFDQAFEAFTNPRGRDGDRWASDILIAAMDT